MLMKTYADDATQHKNFSMAVKCVFEICTKMELTKWREKHVIDQNKKFTSKKCIFSLNKSV